MSPRQTQLVSINNNHSFQTSRLSCRPINIHDRSLYQRLYCCEKVMRNISPPLSIEQANTAFERAIKLQSSHKPKLMSWTIIETSTQQAIGIQGLTWKNKYNHMEADIGFMLLPKANGKLFPEEAMGALVEYAFSYLSLTKITAHYTKANLATQRFVKKLGFTFPEIENELSKAKSDIIFCYAEPEKQVTV
ncbi:GNAT family N-acetyltransferase [Shewanella sp. 10N.261.52.F9]|uniref:GNAT family N-acetyltransferase n=1 Tax=Shewanella sp. 10N.261.52.F9 TaxID=3229684 RepID=UPI003550ADC3